MKRNLLLLLGGALLLSSCYDAGQGAVTGGHFGYVLGSAIGGITGGGRGHDWGALIGTVSGVATGAAIGAATENAREERQMEAARERRRQRSDSYERNSGYDNRERSRYDESDYDDRGRGDDRVDFGIAGPEGNGPKGTVSKSLSSEPTLEIRNAAITEKNRDGVLTRGEECTVRFEIFNMSGKPIFDVLPIVGEVTGNKHVKISPNLRIESIAPHQGIRYTATIVGGKKLKEGEIKVMVGVSHRQHVISSQTRYYTIPTAKGFRD